MTAPRAVATGTTTLHPARDARLVAYALIALLALVGAVATGRPALASLAVPFVLPLAVGLRRTAPVRVSARLTLDARQVLEGSRIDGCIEVEWDGEFDAAEVMLHRLRGVEPASEEGVAWTLPAGRRSASFPVALRATEWGRHATAELWVRLHAPFGLLTWTGRVLAGPTVRVLPGTDRVTRLLEPPQLRTVIGMHRSRRIGDGGEFAQLRPYEPGDRLRDVNWSATARHGRPFVNRYHSERSGAVVLALDAFADGSTTSAALLSRAARAAWALASMHLRAHDRVGLVGLGGRTEWLPPMGGRFARYRLLETLLRIGGEAAHPVKSGTEAYHAVPSAALLIAITALHEPLTLRAVASWRARGRAVAVVVIDTRDLLDEPASPSDALAHRLFLLELERRRRELARLAVPVVSVGVDGPTAPVVSALRHARRAPTMRRQP